MSFSSKRVWAKGSARGAGPKQQSASVQVLESADLGELRICKCGQAKHQCAECARWVCQATGHAKHECGGTW